MFYPNAIQILLDIFLCQMRDLSPSHRACLWVYYYSIIPYVFYIYDIIISSWWKNMILYQGLNYEFFQLSFFFNQWKSSILFK